MSALRKIPDDDRVARAGSGQVSVLQRVDHRPRCHGSCRNCARKGDVSGTGGDRHVVQRPDSQSSRRTAERPLTRCRADRRIRAARSSGSRGSSGTAAPTRAAVCLIRSCRTGARRFARFRVRTRSASWLPAMRTARGLRRRVLRCVRLSADSQPLMLWSTRGSSAECWLPLIDSYDRGRGIDRAGSSLLGDAMAGRQWFLLWFFYSAALESSREQATFGKRMLGMIVCGADGRRLTFARAAIRTLAKARVTCHLRNGIHHAPADPQEAGTARLDDRCGGCVDLSGWHRRMAPDGLERPADGA